MQKRQQVRWSWLAAFASLAVVLTGAMATSASAAKSAQGVCATSAKNQLQSQTNAHEAPCGSAWVDVAPLPQTLFGPATTTDGTYVYAFGGFHFPEAVGSTLNTLYRYDPTANTWTTLAPMPQPSLIASAVYYPTANKIYVFGGATRTPDPVVVYDTTLIYDIASNTWSTGAAMPAPRYQMAAGYNSADGMIYLNGGFETSTIDSVQATTWKYDPVANTFTVKTPSPQMQAGMATGIVNGHLLIAGGRTNPDATLVATWDYDIASDSWTQKQDMMQPTNVPGFAVALSKLWSFGGCTTTPCNPFDGIPTVESFDPVANTWSSEASLNHQRSFPGGTAIGSTLFAVGGRDGLDVSLDTVEKLDLGGPPPPPPPARCRVPRVLGLRLNAAKRRIRAAHCSVGNVRRVRSRRSLRGRVVKQTPRAGTIKRRNFPVKLAVGRS